MKPARSPDAGRALAVIRGLQAHFVRGLEAVSGDHGAPVRFETVSWERDEGRHGGGDRACAADTPVFGRATVNVSQVHYDDVPDRRLSSATAFSTIVHPDHPAAPSMHAHVSFTEMRRSGSYWRMMADLNPSIERPEDTRRFAAALETAAGDLYFSAASQGDRYFHIPALDRHRGATHFYLEGYATSDFEADLALADAVGRAAVDAYLAILDRVLGEGRAPTEEERATQLAYHTLYFFQVSTLDRGTTSGLLVHDQNDVGILGSLPPRVDTDLLASWRDRLPPPQDLLLDRLLDALPEPRVARVDEGEKRAIAAAVRTHYRAHPEALALQAAGDVTPPTVANHIES